MMTLSATFALAAPPAERNHRARVPPVRVGTRAVVPPGTDGGAGFDAAVQRLRLRSLATELNLGWTTPTGLVGLYRYDGRAERRAP